MIDKPLEKITFADIDRFVQQKWPEGKTVDYKRDLYGGKDDDKKELLKDVSSFANTLGGDIIIGVDEDKGVPIGIPGVAVPDTDKEKLRLEGIIRQGLEPRIEFGVHPVAMPTGTSVIVIRVKESLLFPHRVVFQGKFGEFWARSSAGKFSMDTDELRRAFTLSDSVYGQMKAFRQSRVAKLSTDETPVPLAEGGKLVLHFLPVSAFRSRQVFDVTDPQLPVKFPPITDNSGWDSRINLDGVVSFVVGTQQCLSYTQFFRNGIVESVLGGILSVDRNIKRLNASRYEYQLSQGFVDKLFGKYREIGVQTPLWCFLTLIGVKGATIPYVDYIGGPHQVIDRDVLALPEQVVDDLSVDSSTILRPLFDLVWNASGFARSRNFDDSGKWVGR
jgi:hypothetical protein